MSLAPKFYCWPPPPPGFLSQGIQAFFCEDKGHILVLILLITIFHVWVLCVSTNLVFLEWMGLFQLGPPSQKAAQLSEDDHVALRDITCCWLWLRAYMERTFTASVVSQHIELFENGHFDCINILPTLFLKTKPSNQYLGNLWNDWWPNTFGWGWLMAKCIRPGMIDGQMHSAGHHGVSGNPVTLSQILSASPWKSITKKFR